MKNTTFKTTLNIIMIILGVGATGAATAGLITTFSPSTLSAGEVAFYLYAAAGMALMALSDHGGRTNARYGA
jgi:hypothetical protein